MFTQTFRRHGRLGLLAGGSLAALALVFAVSAAPSTKPADPPAAPASKPADKAAGLYEQGMAAVKAQDYAKALGFFQQAGKLKAGDADTMNMTAFCLRKTGKLEDARETYLKALKVRPKFPQAREYLGENYLQLAKAQLDTLAGYGSEGQAEHAMLKQAIIDFGAELEGRKPAGSRSGY